ncbi:proton-conducting transporter membrane subunit [Pseudoroseomonas globiformis]|uniref:Proton-conducting transporter membrane subunit n=1 Tax=Teichococcus globiformis TaxID=2307229 RepID=A0ABV7FU82_9PROT
MNAALAPLVLPGLLIALPLLGGAALAAVPSQRMAALLNIALAAAGFVLALALAALPWGATGLLHVDALNLPLILVGAFVGLTTACFSAAAWPSENFTPGAARAYHAAFQFFLGAHHLALLAENLGLVWVGIEGATIASVLMVGLHRTRAAIEAAWKFLILGGLGIALALFGTITLAVAAQPLLAEGASSLSFAALREVAARADGGLLSLGFVFLLVGYGTKAGLVPLHSWLPDAHAEGPLAISAVLSGLLLNAALHAILRAKAVVGLNAEALPPGALLLSLGVASLLLAAFSLWRRRDARRFFAWSSIEQMGLAAVGFGLGGAASLAGMLQLIGHSLVKSAIFFGLGGAGGRDLAALRGLANARPVLGWSLVVAMLAIAGLPPFSLFASEFLLMQQSVARLPWLALPLGIGLLVGTLAMLRQVQAVALEPASTRTLRAASGETVLPERLVAWAVLGPLHLHLLLALLLGFALPAPLRAVLQEAARIVG